MSSRIERLSNCDQLFCRCKKGDQQEINICSSTPEAGSESISDRLQKLPKVKARQSFDQKMAAAFAMELERETRQRNKSWLKKHSLISLPNVVTDLTKNFT